MRLYICRWQKMQTFERSHILFWYICLSLFAHLIYNNKCLFFLSDWCINFPEQILASRLSFPPPGPLLVLIHTGFHPEPPIHSSVSALSHHKGHAAEILLLFTLSNGPFTFSISANILFPIWKGPWCWTRTLLWPQVSWMSFLYRRQSAASFWFSLNVATFYFSGHEMRFKWFLLDLQQPGAG